MNGQVLPDFSSIYSITDKRNVNAYTLLWNKVWQNFLDKDVFSPKWQKVALVFILFGCATVRILTIGSPAIDRTAWKEIDYLQISRNYWMNGFDFIHPEITWPAEPPRITPIEFPIVPYIAAWFYKGFGYNAFSARSVTLFAFILLTLYVFRLIKREIGSNLALLASFVCACLPLTNFFGKYLFSEPTMIALSVMGVFYLAEWVDYRQKKDWVFAWAALSMAFAIKIECLYILLPILWIGIRKNRFNLGRYKGLVALLFASLVLPAIWYGYAYYLENVGVHAFSIFTGHNKFQTLTMLGSSWWYRAMYENIKYGILGGILGLGLFGIGFLAAMRIKGIGLFYVYMASLGAYFALVAEGQIDGPYRQLGLIPAISVFVAVGALVVMVSLVSLFSVLKKTGASSGWIKLTILTGCFLLFLVTPVRKYDEISNVIRDGKPIHQERWDVAQRIIDLTPTGSKLIVAGEYTIHVGGNDLSPVLYFYSGRQGWTIQPWEWEIEIIREYIEKGAGYFVAMRPMNVPDSAPLLGDETGLEFLNILKNEYRILYDGEDSVILDLRSGKAGLYDTEIR